MIHYATENAAVRSMHGGGESAILTAITATYLGLKIRSAIMATGAPV
jgi:hypothetical protein